VKIKYPYQQAFSQRLRLFLNEEQLSSVSLAKRLNLPRSTVAKWLADKAAPDKARLASVCKALGLDVRAFVDSAAFDADQLREQSMIRSAVKYYEAALAKSDPAMISEALALAGVVTFIGLRQRGLPSVLVADEAGVTQLSLRGRDMTDLRVLVDHSTASQVMFLRVKFVDDVPGPAQVSPLTPVGITGLAALLRGYAANRHNLMKPRT